MTALAASVPLMLVLSVAVVIAGMLLTLLVKRPHPNHEFFLQLLERMRKQSK